MILFFNFFCCSRLTEDLYQTAKVAKVLLLLNEGKGVEFKGKCLSEINISEDIIDFNDEKEIQNEEIENEEEQRIVNESNDKSSTNGKSSTSGSNNLQSTGESSEKLSNRQKWKINDKQKVLKHFKFNIQNRITPKKAECLSFIKKYKEFADKDWVRIKTLVYNSFHK